MNSHYLNQQESKRAPKNIFLFYYPFFTFFINDYDDIYFIFNI